MEVLELEIGKSYNFIGQPERLMYVGMYGNWHQFEKFDRPDEIWAEVLDADLNLIEEHGKKSRN